MPTPFLSTSLRDWWKVWRWTAAQTGPTDIELSLPVQPVADVQRVAELGAANGPNGGYWRVSVVQTHAIAGEISETLLLGGTAGTGEYELTEDDWAWWIAGWGTISAAVHTSSEILWPAPSDRFYGPTDAAAADDVGLLQRFKSGQGGITAGGSLVLLPDAGSRQQTPAFIPFPADVGLQFRSEVSAAGTVALESMIWVGRKGTLPPGMA